MNSLLAVSMARRWPSREPFVITSHPSPVPCKALASIACNHVFPRLSFSFLDRPLRYLGLVSLAYGAEPRLRLIFSAENPGGITKGEDSSPIDTRTLGEIREIGVPSRRRNIADDRNHANLKKRSDISKITRRSVAYRRVPSPGRVPLIFV